jgi:hypothetical protein
MGCARAGTVYQPAALRLQRVNALRATATGRAVRVRRARIWLSTAIVQVKRAAVRRARVPRNVLLEAARRTVVRLAQSLVARHVLGLAVHVRNARLDTTWFPEFVAPCSRAAFRARVATSACPGAALAGGAVPRVPCRTVQRALSTAVACRAPARRILLTPHTARVRRFWGSVRVARATRTAPVGPASTACVRTVLRAFTLITARAYRCCPRGQVALLRRSA